MWLRKKVRELNQAYEDRLRFLKTEYEEELLRLQAKCHHDNTTRWQYEVDEYGEVASTADGVLIKFRECLDCGLIEQQTDNINNYDSEIPL